MSTSGFSLALNKLDELGLKPSKSIGLTRCFDGELNCAKGPVKIRFAISDWEFTTYPEIIILQRPDFLPTLTPHISGSGLLCYFIEGRVVLDRYRPDHAIEQCIQQATQEIDRLSRSAPYREREFRDEFGAHWEIGQTPAPHPVLMGNISDTNAVLCFYVDAENSSYVVIASEERQVKALADACNWSEPKPMSVASYVVKSYVSPHLPKEGLPETIAEIFRWIKSWDRALMKQINIILGESEWLQFKAIQFLINSPEGWFGFFFKLDSNRVVMYKRKSNGYRQFLHNKGNEIPISRISIRQISPDFIHSRNLLFPSLIDKKVTVIGCGAIGGYLTQALVKLGAGSGKGKLTIIDPEVLEPDNVGRHFLGMDCLYKPKATALKEMLTSQFPHANIIAEPRGIVYQADITGDLIIDSTGEEAVSEAINANQKCAKNQKLVPVLHIWIVGNGECAQALWVDHPKYACYRCMRRTDPARSARFPVLQEAPKTRMVGCSAYTPYAVSAPMAASALAIDMTIDWLKGDVSPRFRTRSIEGAKVRSVKNQNVKPLKGCPGCAHRSS